MGCDIHLIVETRPNDTEPWEMLPGPIVTCWSCEGHGIVTPETHPRSREGEIGKPCYWCATAPDEDGYVWRENVGEPGKTRESWYDDRNYIVFAAVANVRNGSGSFLADANVTPIDDPRGLPDDLGAEGVAWFANYGGDHSASWLDLREVLAYDWNAPIRKHGVLQLDEWAHYRATGTPDNWCGGIGGQMVRNVDAAEMDRQLARALPNPNVRSRFDHKLISPDGLLYCADVIWTEPLTRFTERFIERMKMVLAITGEQPTRLVFNFDS